MSNALEILSHLALASLALPAVAASVYLLSLTLLSARLPLPPASSRTLRFDVIVPAHNEALVIERCLASLHALDWPPSQFRLLLIADNCDDNTAHIGRAAGAIVLERRHATLRSKGYALQFAFAHSRAGNWADACVVIDADAQVSPNLLEAFAARIETGAGVIQAHYGVLNPADSWRTRLLAIAHGAFHGVRSAARERLGVSCGLRGNGWCATHAVLDAVPYKAFSLTEDLEYGIELGLAGLRVHYAAEAFANAEMASDEKVARHQRQRWEDGRFALIRNKTLPLLREAWRRRSLTCLDLAADLLVLPLSYVAMNITVMTGAGLLISHWHASAFLWVWLGLGCAVLVTLYVLRGWQLSGRGLRGLADLAVAPLFLLWRLFRILRPHDRLTWIATKRRGS